MRFRLYAAILMAISAFAIVAMACSFSLPSNAALPTRMVLELDQGISTETPTETLFPFLLTPLSTFTPIPSHTPPPTPTPTPAPQTKRLTSGGCCVEPFFSPDGERILFIDKPAPDAPSGLWFTDREAGFPQFLTDKLGIFSADLSLRAFPQNGATNIERLADGARWTISNGGRAISFSPDGSQIAWTAGQSGPPFDTALRQVWVSNVDGSQARQAIQVYGGGFNGWLQEGNILVNGRMEVNGPDGLWVVAPDGAITNLVESERMRSVNVSPGGSWIIYQQLFSSDQAANGIFLVRTDGSRMLSLPLFGAYRWRDDQRLLFVPLEPEASAHRLLQLDLTDGTQCELTDPQVTAFKIANGDWSVAPDGNSIVYVSAEDHNIWLLSLPPDICSS